MHLLFLLFFAAKIERSAALRRGNPGLERRDGRINSGNSAVGLLSSAVSRVWLKAQVLSGPYTHKDLDGVPTAPPPIAASDDRNRSRRLPAESFRSSATARTPRLG